MNIKTEHVKQWATGVVELSEILGITHGAVSQWGEFVPSARVYQLKVLRPDWFFKNGNLKPPPSNPQGEAA